METPTHAVSSSTVTSDDIVTLRIDKLGRVVVPQAVRERLNLQPGTKLQLSYQNDDSIVLKVVSEDPVVERINGVPVIRASGAEKFDSVEVLNEVRAERNRKNWGIGE